MFQRQVLLHKYLQQHLPILDVCQIVTQYEREFQCEADHFTFRTMRDVTCLAALSADVVAFGFGNGNSKLEVWNIETGIRMWSTDHHCSEIRAIKRLSSKGFIAWSLDGHICVWGINGVDCIFEVQLDVAAGFVKEVAAVCANSKLLVAFEHLVYVFDVRTAQNHSFEAHDKPITGLVVLSDDCKYVTCADDGFVRLWTVASNTCLCEIPASYPRALTALDHGLFAFKYDSSKSIAVHESLYPSADRSFYNCNEGERVNVIAKLSEWKVASAMHNGRVFEWDIFTGKKREFPNVRKEPITSMFMFDDGKKIVAFTNNGFQIWDAKTLKLTFTCAQNVSSMVGLSSCKLVASCWREGVTVFY